VGAEHPKRRELTAREAAERLGIAPRTVRKIVAEPREEYLARAKERRERVLALRAQGMKLKDIAAQVGMTVGGVGATLHEARKRAAAQEAQAVPESA